MIFKYSGIIMSSLFGRSLPLESVGGMRGPRRIAA